MIGNKKLAVIGAGNMGETIIGSLLDADMIKRQNIVATAGHQARIDYIANKFDIRCSLDNARAAKDADIILICVKPQTVKDVLEQIRRDLKPGQLVISIAASVTTQFMEAILMSNIPVIRTMPNTPCLIRYGMTGICKGTFAIDEHLQLAKSLFDAVGRTVLLDEKHMDAVTGLSASGPAFIYIVIESLAEAGVKVGLPRDVATQLAAQTVFGAANMVLTTNEHPARLKDMVTTPAGCTIDGILELEDGGLRVTLIKAVVKATQRAKELVGGSK